MKIIYIKDNLPEDLNAYLNHYILVFPGKTFNDLLTDRKKFSDELTEEMEKSEFVHLVGGRFLFLPLYAISAERIPDQESVVKAAKIHIVNAYQFSNQLFAIVNRISKSHPLMSECREISLSDKQIENLLSISAEVDKKIEKGIKALDSVEGYLKLAESSVETNRAVDYCQVAINEAAKERNRLEEELKKKEKAREKLIEQSGKKSEEKSEEKLANTIDEEEAKKRFAELSRHTLRAASTAVDRLRKSRKGEEENLPAIQEWSATLLKSQSGDEISPVGNEEKYISDSYARLIAGISSAEDENKCSLQAYAYFNTGNFPRATGIYTKLHQKNKQNIEYIMMLGKISYKLKQSSEAMKWYRMGLNLLLQQDKYHKSAINRELSVQFVIKKIISIYNLSGYNKTSQDYVDQLVYFMMVDPHNKNYYQKILDNCKMNEYKIIIEKCGEKLNSADNNEPSLHIKFQLALAYFEYALILDRVEQAKKEFAYQGKFLTKSGSRIIESELFESIQHHKNGASLLIECLTKIYDEWMTKDNKKNGWNNKINKLNNILLRNSLNKEDLFNLLAFVLDDSRLQINLSRENLFCLVLAICTFSLAEEAASLLDGCLDKKEALGRRFFGSDSMLDKIINFCSDKDPLIVMIEQAKKYYEDLICAVEDKQAAVCVSLHKSGVFAYSGVNPDALRIPIERIGANPQDHAPPSIKRHPGQRGNGAM